MRIETIKVSCPYCLVGHAAVPAVIHRDQVQVRDMKTPRACTACGNYIVLKPRVTLDGITLEQARKEGRHVA